MVKPCVFLLAIALAAGPALAFSDEYKREIVDRRDSGVLYGRDIEFADFLEKRRLQGPLAAVLKASRPKIVASGTPKASFRSKILGGLTKSRSAVFNHGSKALENVHHTTSMAADVAAAYHNANPYNSNMKPAPKRRELEELSERDLDDEELFGREYYDLDERDIIDDLD